MCMCQPTSGLLLLRAGRNERKEMTMSRDERAIYDFKAAQHLIPMAPDGFPTPHQFLDLEVGALGRMLLKVDMILAGRSELSAAERSVKILCDATAPWI